MFARLQARFVQVGGHFADDTADDRSSSSFIIIRMSSGAVQQQQLLLCRRLVHLPPSSATAQLAGRRPARMHAAVPRGIEKVGEGIFYRKYDFMICSFQKRPTVPQNSVSARSRRPEAGRAAL